MTTPPISILRNAINALGGFRGEVNVARDFAIRVQPPAVEGDAHFLAANGWKIEREKAIFIHAKCGAP